MKRTQEQINQLEKELKEKCRSYYKLQDGTVVRETTDEITQINSNKTGIHLKFEGVEWFCRGSKQFTFGGYTPGDGVFVEIHYNTGGAWIKRITKRGGNVFKK